MIRKFLIPFLAIAAIFATPAISQTSSSSYSSATTAKPTDPTHTDTLQDGQTVTDGTRTITVAGGKAKYKWTGDGTPTRDGNTITLPAGAKLTEATNASGNSMTVTGDNMSVDNDKGGATINVNGDNNELKIDKPGTWNSTGQNQSVTVQGSSAGQYTFNGTGSGSITVNGSNSGSMNLQSGGPNQSWHIH